MREGSRRKQTMRYSTANQRYLAVRSPSALAMRMGRRVKGSGYHSRIPEILKKKQPGMGLRKASGDSNGAGWPRGRRGPIPLTPQWSLSHSPVLMTFWMALATCPLSRELRSLTRRMRQVQSTMRDPASSTSPTARSGSGVSVKRCSPVPQHCWARGWGQPSPTHKPAPSKTPPPPGPQPQHLPALPHIMSPAPCPAHLHPTYSPLAPPAPPQPRTPPALPKPPAPTHTSAW
uniref:Uncharacterized protein n=1 Tax=Aquila chrysaetos chrysaetos TaxID=223781 RepID=A0A663F5H3_AQUCH